jgi:hypothetical protein
MPSPFPVVASLCTIVTRKDGGHSRIPDASRPGVVGIIAMRWRWEIRPKFWCREVFCWLFLAHNDFFEAVLLHLIANF